MTIKDKIKILEAMLNNTNAFYHNLLREGREAEADSVLCETIGLQSALWLFTDPKYAKGMQALYFKEATNDE